MFLIQNRTVCSFSRVIRKVETVPTLIVLYESLAGLKETSQSNVNKLHDVDGSKKEIPETFEPSSGL